MARLSPLQKLEMFNEESLEKKKLIMILRRTIRNWAKNPPTPARKNVARRMMALMQLAKVVT